MGARLRVVSLLILLFARTVPRIDGVELEGIRGWFANIYPWTYDPSLATVYPVRDLWRRPNDFQSAADISAQNALLARYGSGADVLEYRPNPDPPGRNQWLRTYFTNGERPFFIAYEHVYGTRMVPPDGAKDMNLRVNRETFRLDHAAIVRNVGLPYQHRYVTFHGRAVIFLWAASAMYGDFASLLNEIRAEYPVVFI